jgi:hypothetical protein
MMGDNRSNLLEKKAYCVNVVKIDRVAKTESGKYCQEVPVKKIFMKNMPPPPSPEKWLRSALRFHYFGVIIGSNATHQ